MLDLIKACRHVNAFVSVAISHFDLSVIHQGQRVLGQQLLDRPAAMVRQRLTGLLSEAEDRGWDLILRPKPVNDRLIVQLDDLEPTYDKHIRDAAFLVVMTSPGSYQAWIAVLGTFRDAKFARRVQTACGADIGATGAGRIAGRVTWRSVESGPPRNTRAASSSEGSRLRSAAETIRNT